MTDKAPALAYESAACATIGPWSTPFVGISRCCVAIVALRNATDTATR